ncbi:MAG: porin family protein [Rhizobiales bacterium]|nr:porin family protein [Hyphomicrobiales bacterium]
MNLKTLLLASTVALVAASGAKAADAVVAQEPAPVAVAPAFSWTGPYIGGQVGWGWAKSKFSDGDSLKMSPNGFLGGVYGGYNYDFGNNFVGGIEGDVTYNDVHKTLGDYASLETKLRWAGAVRARVGYSAGRFLPYIAGGVAFGDVKNTVSAGALSVSQSKTLTGWTAGAGVDYAVTDNVILRAEYRYTDFGHKNYDFGTNGLVSVRDKFKTNEVRLGVAYKF